MHRTEKQRMMDNEQIRSPIKRLVDDGAGGIGGEGDARDGLGELAHNKPRLVPTFRITQRI